MLSILRKAIPCYVLVSFYASNNLAYLSSYYKLNGALLTNHFYSFPGVFLGFPFVLCLSSVKGIWSHNLRFIYLWDEQNATRTIYRRFIYTILVNSKNLFFCVKDFGGLGRQKGDWQTLQFCSIDRSMIFFKKWANPGLFFVYLRSFQANITIFTTNICEKMSIQYTVPVF